MLTSLLVFLSLLVALASLLFLWWRRYLSYWSDRGIVHEKPTFLYGNLRAVGRTQMLSEPFNQLYAKYKHVAPFGGFYMSLRLAVVLFDLELIKHVLIKDFANFADRGNYHNVRDDPISGHMFNLDGAAWRNIRTKLTPTFTSGKMKLIFPIVVDVAERLLQVLGNAAAAQQSDAQAGVEMKDLLARYTTDVIGSCAFGLECNSLHDPQTHFRTMSKKIFTHRRHGRLVFAFAQAWPDVARFLRLQMVPADVSDFFLKMVRDTVEYREREGVKRNDFMNLLIELKQQPNGNGLTLEQIAAQAFLFFIAGFETSSSTMGFALYELALHQEMQECARNEIETVLAEHDGQLNYECIGALKYLRQVFCETLRKYSIAQIIGRKTINDYQVPGTKYTIPRGMTVIIPVDAIHRDPDIYADPERFDPERFTAEAIAQRHPMAWLPFGEGPRNCIGLRFGEMQTLVGLALLLKNYKFTPSAQLKVPLQMKLDSFILTSKEGIRLHVEPLNDIKAADVATTNATNSK